MIKVNYQYDREARKISLLVKGHAGQADVGKDIICASASILSYTAAQIVKSMERHGDLCGEPTLKLIEGNAEITCEAKDEYIFSELLTMLFAITTGYTLLAHNYPQYLHFKNQDVTPHMA